MGVENTTESALRDTIRTAILGITPTATEYSAEKWVEGTRSTARGSLKTRRFTVHLRDMADGPENAAGWSTGGQTQDVSVIVETHYAIGSPKAMEIVMQDHRDLRDTISRLKHTASNGIWYVESEGHDDPPDIEDDKNHDQWVCAHQFMVRYQVARSYT